MTIQSSGPGSVDAYFPKSPADGHLMGLWNNVSKGEQPDLFASKTDFCSSSQMGLSPVMRWIPWSQGNARAVQVMSSNPLMLYYELPIRHPLLPTSNSRVAPDVLCALRTANLIGFHVRHCLSPSVTGFPQFCPSWNFYVISFLMGPS